MTTDRYEETLPGTPDQVGAARKTVADRLGEDHACAEVAALLTSEVVTNAIVHTDTGRLDADGRVGTFTLAVTHVDDRVRIEVTDAGAETLPCRCRTESCEDGGRGIPMIEALATRWGYTREPRGTTVWLELQASDPSGQ